MDAFRLDPLLLEEFALDPWEVAPPVFQAGLFQPGVFQSAGAAPTGRTAALSQTLGVTLAATATVPLSAAASGTVSITPALTAAVLDTAQLAATLAVPSLAATATAPARAQLSQAVSLALAATATAPDSASLAATLAVPSLTATATAPDSAALAQTVGVTLAATATAPLAASLAGSVDLALAAGATVGSTADLALAGTVGLTLAATATAPLDAVLAATTDFALAATTAVPVAATVDGAVGVGLASTLVAGTVLHAALDGVVEVSVSAAATAVVAAQLDASVDLTLAAAGTVASHAGLAGAVDFTLAATAGTTLQAQAAATVSAMLAAQARVAVQATATATLELPALVARATTITAALPSTVDGTDVVRPSTEHYALRPSGGVHDVPRPRTTTSAARRTAAPVLSSRPHAAQTSVGRAGDTQMCIFRKSKPHKPKPLPPRYALVNRTLDSFTLAAEVALADGPGARSASLEVTIGGVTLASSATRTPAKTAALAGLVDFGFSGTVGLPAARSASLAANVEAPALVAIGAVSSPRSASLDRQLPGFALQAAAHVGALPSARSARLAATVAQVSLQAHVSFPQPLHATLSGAVSLALSAGAQHGRQARVAATAPRFTLSAAARVKHTASLARTAPSFTLAATASGPIAAPPIARLRGTAAVSVKSYGALGNGLHNDTAAFNAAIAALPSDGGTVTVPAGTYMIDPVVSVKLRSRMHLQLDPAATLKAIVNTNPRCYVLTVRLVNNVEISGGTIIGDLDGFVPQSGTTSEWKHDIACYGSTAVTIHDIHLTKAPGDGISIGGASTTSSSDVLLYNVRSDYNRRQGLSIVGASNITVRDSQFNYTKGTSPECGIDIEPEATAPATNILIQRCELAGNNKYGLNLLRRSDGNDIDGVRIEDCDVHHNASNGLVTYGGTNVVVTGGKIRLNSATGLFTTGTTNMNVYGITFTSNYTRNGITTRTAFDLVGTSSPKTDKDILLRNLTGTTSTAGRVIGLNHYT